MRSPPRAVRVITINEMGVPVHQGLLMVEAHTRLVFSIPPNHNMDMSSVLVWTNCPLSPDIAFHRHTYHCLEGSDADTLDSEWQAFIDLAVPGAFEFFVEFAKQDKADASAGERKQATPQHVTNIKASPVKQPSIRLAHVNADGVETVEAPAQARRGPISRFVVQPELVLRLLRPLTSAEIPTATTTTDENTTTSAPQQDSKIFRHYDRDTARLLPRLGLGSGCSVSYEEAPLPLPLEALTLQTQLLRCLGPLDWWLQMQMQGQGQGQMQGVGLSGGALGADTTVGMGTTTMDMGMGMGIAGGVSDMLGTSGKAGYVLRGTLAEALACKYNMLHFTPLQQLGGSNSAYSIADQLTLEPTMFAANAAVAAAYKSVLAADGARMKPEVRKALTSHPAVEAAKMAVLARMIDVIERQHGALSMVDIVLNHTSTDTWWLASHPEAGYSLRNSPHLRSAFELDETILRVSDAICNGKVPGARAAMNDPHAVNTAIDVLKHHSTYGLPAARLWEFYCLDVTGTLAAAAAMHPDVLLKLEDAAGLTSKDNVEGADPGIPDATVGFTPGVQDQELSPMREHELLACKHDVVKTILQAYKSHGYVHGSGEHCAHISDKDVQHIADSLMAASSSACEDVEAAVERLRKYPASEMAPPSRAKRVLSTSTSDSFAIAPTPVPAGEQTPQISPRTDFSDHVSPSVHATNQYPFGVPPSQSRDNVPHPQPAVAADHDRYTSGLGMVPLMIPPAPVASTQNVARARRNSALWSRTPPAYVARHMSNVSSTVSPLSKDDAASYTGVDTSDFSAGVFNDGSGARFSVHVDLDKLIAALNTVGGIRVNPSSWQLPSASSPAWMYSTNDGSLGILPSLFLIQRVLQAINLRLYQRYDSDIGSAINAISGTAHYQWLGVWEGKQSMSSDRPLVYSYFSRTLGTTTDGRSCMHVLACNGFIWNGDPEIDFTLPVDSARMYAKLVREGTTKPAYVKRPRNWSKKRQAKSIGLKLEIEDASSDSISPQARTSPVSQQEHLLCFSKGALRVLNDEFCMDGMGAVDTAVWHLASHSSAEDVAYLDLDAVPHLRPDVVQLPIATASTPYMRRDIVIWGDCVKLRYGLSPSDSPWLWAYMTVYVRRMAKVFQAFRIDNAHGTPLHVAASMIDSARAVRPELYVNAELFTGSIDRDVEYVSRLGINSLVRECMQCSSPDELLTSIYSYGGVPIASLRPPLRGQATAVRLQAMYAAQKAIPLVKKLFSQSQHNLSNTSLALLGENTPRKTTQVSQRPRNPLSTIGGFDITALPAHVEGMQPVARSELSSSNPLEMLHKILTHVNESRVGEVLPAPLPALFFDCTHDNTVPYAKRHAVDAISSAVLTSAAVCATGTNRGFDLLVPHNISVVHDMRLYALPNDEVDVDEHLSSSTPCILPTATPYAVNMHTGLLKLRRRLNLLKQEMALRGHIELFAAKYGAPNGSDIVTVSRGHPSLSSSYLFITRTAFSQYAGNARGDFGPLPEITVEGRVTSVVCAASLYVPHQYIRTAAPDGPVLYFPPPEAADIETCSEGPTDEMRKSSIHWKKLSSGRYPDKEAFDADERTINGLHCHLEYSDDLLPAGAAAHDPLLGLARFAEIDADGKEVEKGSIQSGEVSYTKIRLDQHKFQPGSIIILRVRAPRNVVIRSTSGEEQQAEESSNLVSTPLPLDSPKRSSTKKVIDAVGYALHGPPSEKKPFRSSMSSGSLLALLDAEVLDGSAAGSSPPARLPRQPKQVPNSMFYGPPLSALESALLRNPAVTLVSLNKLLYRCHEEEMDDSYGSRGVYHLTDVGPLPWAGIAGIIPTLRHCRKWNDMGHAVLENIRRGPWLMDYLVGRLRDVPELDGVRSWLDEHFAILKRIPAGLRPQGFDRVITAVFHVAVAAALALMESPLFPQDVYAHSQHYLVSVFEHLSCGDEEEEDHHDDLDASLLEEDSGVNNADFVKSMQVHTDPAAPLPFLTALAMTSVQLFGYTRSAPLLALRLLEPAGSSDSPVGRIAAGAGVAPSNSHLHASSPAVLVDAPASLAAGVPHFATGYMRNWGRDTFISVRGLLLVTGRFAEARACILSFATVARHGLMPNLMDGGKNPRFNCRDAAWWFLQAVKDYCHMAPDGLAILSTRIHRRFPSDNIADYDDAGNYRAGQTPSVTTLAGIIIEILDKHAKGIHFREWNAGPRIDAHMKDEGFQIDVTVDPRTGFVHGGNAWNCGTWMDKMGECAEFGTDGVPATPRDGADIEIVALCYSVLSWLATVPTSTFGHAPSFSFTDGSSVSFGQWSNKIKENFERCFYVPLDPALDGGFALDPRYVNVRGVYKDVVGSTTGWNDYQLRPNQLVAMAVAPALFRPDHAADALGIIEQRLLGDHQLGVKTLDPADWAYRGDYDNSSMTDRTTAKGWNYHQGPEWLWPYGYYLRARISFPPPQCADAAGRWLSYEHLRRWIFAKLTTQRQYIASASDGGLPELTNANGKHCKDSCSSQAWSSATLLDALYDLHAVTPSYEPVKH